MTLYGATRMQHTLRSQVCGMGLLRRVVASKAFPFSIDLDSCCPLLLALMPTHPNESRFAIAAWGAPILTICRPRYVAQIGYTIIRRLSINVINYLRRPCAVNVKPCETVGSIYPPFEPDYSVAFLINGPDSSSLRLRSRNQLVPRKDPSLRVIVNLGKQFRVRNYIDSQVFTPEQITMSEVR